ncbi:hypothetical protein EHSB41UT_03750 [Parendozoicomonas haliclonae]|uniref:Uncharacterized protein n=1 Tax=Parendozoicomonas haliclonae TaxID=1960125 RepID=A0A1X7APF1_9GAMM|nr:hypothetical protein EHSB41UT_03750 [Parendozoicomonas haliclonae]
MAGNRQTIGIGQGGGVGNGAAIFTGGRCRGQRDCHFILIIRDRGDHFLLAERQVLKLAASGDAGNAVGHRIPVLDPNIITIDGPIHRATGGTGLNSYLLLVGQRDGQTIVVINR